METKLPPISQRIIATILAVVMVVGFVPTQAYANTSEKMSESTSVSTSNEEQKTSEDASANFSNSGISSAIEEVNNSCANIATEATIAQDDKQADEDAEALLASQAKLTLKGVHSAQINSFKLYTYTNGQKGETNLLEGVELVDDPDGGNQMMYVTTVESGDYWVEGYDANNAYNGGIAINVADGQNNRIKIQRAYQIYATNTKTVDSQSVKWEFGTDYTVDYVVKDASGNVHATDFGEADSYGTVYKSSLFIAEGTISTTFTPSDEYATDYMPITVTKNSTNTKSSLSISTAIPKALSVTVNAPAGSTISVGNMATYYVYTWFDGTIVKDDETGVSETFRVPSSMTGNRFYRVQNPDGVTYWKYNNWTSDSTVEVTADDLHIGDDDFTKSTVYRFEKNIYDRADIYLNINKQGYKNMQVGDTFELNVFRNWMAIESFMNSKVALPDMHYSVVDAQGNESDVVSIAPDENNSSVATMTANKAGTAIVMISYDSMTHMDGQSSTSSKEFSAIWPECTGMFIVNVGADGSSIQTNMMVDRVDEGTEPTSIDAEHDILFYLGDKGANYSFTPESGTTVTVDRSVVTDQMTFTGFTSEGVTTNAETGEVTVSGLTSGRHIIKVEKNGVANYQVVTARETSYEVLDAEGNKIEDLTQIKAGDTIQLQFSNLVMPCEKMSGIYNNNASIYYKGEDGTMFKSNGGTWGVYDFSGNPVRQLISLTIPKYWEGDTYSLTGGIKLGGFSTYPPGGHRGVTYATGVNPNYNAGQTNSIISVMPDLSIQLGQTNFITGTFNFTDESGATIDAKDFTKIDVKDSEGNEIEVGEDGTFSALEDTYTYTTYINGYRYATGEIEVIEGDQNIFDIQLESTSDGAWDGISTSEPEQDANGVYQIKTGAELAWIGKQSNLSKDAITDASLVLCNDIDLAGYTWTKGIKGNGGMIFDGAGHKITDLNSSVALIDNIGGTGSVSNLTVEGVSTGPAGIVKNLNGGSITNCVSDVDITPTDISYIGGIVGTAAENTTVSKCINKGNINATNASYVGGIVGRSSGVNFKLANSYNTGDITGSNYVGGVAGSFASDSNATACYNLGSVEGISNVGGFIGLGASSSFASCYSAGTVTGGNQFVGSGNSSTYEQCYALEDDVLTDNCAELLSEADLKSADLATWYFAPTCTGYPALLWQTDVTFHEATGEGTDVAPTCLDKGYTIYTCSKCNATYKGNYTEPTGHIAGDDITMHSTYTQYTCTKCNKVIKEYFDPNLAALTIPDTGVSSISLSEDSDYPWIGTDTGLESTCQGVVSGESTSILKFNLDYGGKIGFNYSVSSENDCDKLIITLYSPDGKEIPICSGISGESSGTYTGRNLTPGSYQLKLSYVKNSSVDDGLDKGSISNFYINPGDEASAVSSVIAKINAIYTPVSLDCEDSIVTARKAYDSLLPTSQAKVTNYSDLVAAESALAALKAPESDKVAAAEVIEAIDAIVTPITVDSQSSITAAREAYNNLTESQKALVTNYSTLVEDESALAALNKSAADSVALQISALGKITPGVSDEAIANARAAYDALTDTQKALVPNYKTLTDAEAALDSGYAKQVYNIIDALGEITMDSGDAIENARAAYETLTDTQKALVSNYDVLKAAELTYHDFYAPVILTKSLPEAYNGSEYSVLIEATGIPAPTITVTGLPSGITYDPETSIISGTPGKIGTYEVTVEATNDTDTATEVFELIVYKKNLTRLGGTTRLDTMSLIFDNAVPDNNTSEIIVTTAWNYADALAASSLMGSFNATLITTDGTTLSAQSKKQIERISNGAANVHILGGRAAVSQEVENELKEMPRVASVDRIYGDTRVETANEIYKYAGEQWGDTCIITNAWNYADALSIGAFCATNAAPIFGATGGTIDETQAQEIIDGKFSKIVIVGGNAAVNSEAVKSVLKKAGISTNTEYLVLAGDDRYETSKIIVDWECGNYTEAQFQPSNILGQTEICFATGNGYADALAGVNLAYTHDCPIMLVTESDACKEAFYEFAPSMNFAWIFGGTGVVSETIEDWISEAID